MKTGNGNTNPQGVVVIDEYGEREIHEKGIRYYSLKNYWDNNTNQSTGKGYSKIYIGTSCAERAAMNDSHTDLKTDTSITSYTFIPYFSRDTDLLGSYMPNNVYVSVKCIDRPTIDEYNSEYRLY